MYIIGIDISKFKHDCYIKNTITDEVIKENLSFENSFEGFQIFLSVLKSLDQGQEIRIGLEATGHYGENLKLFLYQNNYSFMEFNPVLTSRSRQVSSMRKTKNDKIDAKIIANMLLTNDYKPFSIKSYHILKLKSLTRYRKRLVEERTKYIVSLHNIIDLVFPEYPRYFSQFNSTVSLYILKKYKNINNISKININKEYKYIQSLSKNRYSLIKFTKLVNAAKTSIGIRSDIYDLELETTISMIDNYDEKISIMEKEIIKIMNNHDFKTATIKGISIISAASIVSEFGDICNFESPGKMLAFAGLEPSTYESGTMKTHGHMVKHGSPYLRETLMNVANFVILYNYPFYSYYKKKRDEGKHHRVALSHVAKKLLRVIYNLETRNINFDPSKLK